MEEVKFWTKGKIIILLSIIGIILLIVGIVNIFNNNQKKKYIELENQFTYAAPNYMLKEQLTLKKGQYRKININDILKQKLVINEIAKNCNGYVIAKSYDGKNTDYKTYISCKNYYTTANYGSSVAGTENKSKTQSQKDTKKPVLKLIGKSTVSVKINGKYAEKGAVATDNVDGNITKRIKISGKVDTSKIGEYIITYTVTDNAGNKASIKRKVLVKEVATKEEKDTTKPVITFTSDVIQTICAGTQIDTSKDGVYGYVAYDDKDGDITNNVKITGDTGIMNNPGTYNLSYSVSDKAGNSETISKSYSVKDCSEKSTTVTTPTTPAVTPSSTPSPSPAPSPAPSNPTNNVTPNTNTPTITVKVTSILLTPSSKTIGVGGSFRITATAYPSTASQSFTFSSSNSGVATVDSSGNVRGVSRGSATINVRSNVTPSVSSNCTVIVN